MKLKVAPQIVGNAGLFYVCHRLSALGWHAMPTSRNAKGIDVMCFSPDGKTKYLLQIKSLAKVNPVPLGSSCEKLMGDYWIIVTEAISKRPTCFILTPAEVRHWAHKGQNKEGKVSYWLQPSKYAKDDFRERWDLLKPEKAFVIASIVEFLGSADSDHPLSKADLLKKLTTRFPDRPPEAMKKTINTQVPAGLAKQKGFCVKGTSATGYWIEQ